MFIKEEEECKMAEFEIEIQRELEKRKKAQEAAKRRRQQSFQDELAREQEIEQQATERETRKNLGSQPREGDRKTIDGVPHIYSGSQWVAINPPSPAPEPPVINEPPPEDTAATFYNENADSSDMFGSETSGTVYLVDASGNVFSVGNAEAMEKYYSDGSLIEGLREATNEEITKYKSDAFADAYAFNLSTSLADSFKLGLNNLEGMMSAYFEANEEAAVVPSTASTYDQMKGLYPWLDDRLIRVYLDRFHESGSERLAIAEMRQDPIMDTVYPGIRREDGTLRMTEEEYVVVVDNMKSSLRQFNLNPTEFEEDIVEAISGDVSPKEFATRLQAGYDGIVNNIPQVKQAYLDNFGIELPDESIFGMFISPKVATNILEGNIRASQILGEAEAAGFSGISAQVAASLSKQGLTQETARQGFGAAALNLSGIQAAAKSQGRQGLTAADYIEATQLGSAEDVEALNRILAQQRGGSAAATGAAQNQEGQTTGLTER